MKISAKKSQRVWARFRISIFIEKVQKNCLKEKKVYESVQKSIANFKATTDDVLVKRTKYIFSLHPTPISLNYNKFLTSCKLLQNKFLTSCRTLQCH